MGAVRKYHVTHNGHETIMRLNDVDLKNYPGARPVDEPTPAEDGDETKPAGKARTAANKARGAANKASD